MRFEFTHVGGDAGHVAMFEATKLVDDKTNTAYRTKLFELYYSPHSNPVEADDKANFMDSMLMHTRRNMREPTRMKEVEGAGTVITTNLGAEFYKVAGSTGKSNPGAKGHIREIIYDGMGKFAEAPRVCADQCKASVSQASGFDVTTQGGTPAPSTCVAFEVRADDLNANIHCILWSIDPQYGIKTQGLTGIRGQYVMVQDSSKLPQIALGLGIAAGLAYLAYRFFPKKEAKGGKRGIVKPAQVFAAPVVHAAPPVEEEEPVSPGGYFPLFAPAPQYEVVSTPVVLQPAPMQSVAISSAPVMRQASGSVAMSLPQYGGSYGGSYGGGLMGGPSAAGYGMLPTMMQ
jgi:hypothetical protein